MSRPGAERQLWQSMPRTIAEQMALSLTAVFFVACSSSPATPRSDGGDAGRSDMQRVDAASADGGGCVAATESPDGVTFKDEVCGCPAGTVCVSEIGGLAGGGGFYCSPIPEACHGRPSCACMETCACAHFSFTNRACYDQDGSIACDNLIR
ncbi:MAG TPA: hypothetical protein VHO06_19235 [Polyangia bacterium]|nr:hypothetical protein [Polyangia bacterium]